MKDCWHFITKEGFIFTTRGNIHPEGFVLAIGVYYPDEEGNRTYKGVNYSKKVDEYGEKWIKDFHPEYITQDERGTRILVPTTDIEKYFDPFSITEETREVMKQTKWGKLIEILKELIPKEDIGFIGSYLIGFPTENSDIDIVIRGVNNLKIIKENISKIHERLNATSDLDEYLTKISLEKYYGFYSKDKNNFGEMIKNRWVTIRTPEYMTKLRFIPEEDLNFPLLTNKIDEIEISGEVVNDIGTNFMPRFFEIKTDKDNYFVLTYFWDYTYCVKEGDKVTVSGALFENNVIMINNKNEHGINFN